MTLPSKLPLRPGPTTGTRGWCLAGSVADKLDPERKEAGCHPAEIGQARWRRWREYARATRPPGNAVCTERLWLGTSSSSLSRCGKSSIVPLLTYLQRPSPMAKGGLEKHGHDMQEGKALVHTLWRARLLSLRCSALSDAGYPAAHPARVRAGLLRAVHEDAHRRRTGCVVVRRRRRIVS
jgi:hypothetical protein